jgi:hypothetical protein
MIGTKPYDNSTLIYDGLKPESRFLCHNVKIISFEHASINFITVIGIAAATVLLVAISFSINSIAARLQSRWGQRPSWMSNTSFDLLKLATPELGWAQNVKAGEIPVVRTPDSDLTPSPSNTPDDLMLTEASPASSRLSHQRRDLRRAEQCLPASESEIGLAVSTFENEFGYSGRSNIDPPGEWDRW